MRILPRLTALVLTALLTPVSLPAQDGKDVGVFRRENAPALGRRLAVVVGIDEYESLRKLDCAQRDAEDVARELEAIGFTVRQMRVDGRGDAPRPLSPTAILAQIDKMCRLAQGSGTVLFYFSGHGFENQKGQTFLCPFGTDPAQLEGTGLDLEEVQKRLIASGVPQRLLVVDMCRNEPGKSATEAPIRLERFQKAQGTGLLFSTAPGSRSYEPLPGMKDDAGAVIQNGLFTHYLLRGLRGEADRGAQAKADGFVTFREVAYFVADGLAAMSMRHSQCEQVPYLRWDGTAADVLLRVLGDSVPVATPVVQPTVPPAAQSQQVVPSKPEVAGGRDVSSWAKVLRVDPDPNVVTDAEARTKIVASGWPWRVEDKVSGIVLLLVPPGEFLMGSPASEGDRRDDETQHRRRITKPFYLGETEVAQAAWQQVMSGNPSNFQGVNNPVENVSWDDIQPFLEKTGLALPTEAQWEYACRAGTATTYWFGSRPGDGRGTGNYCGPSTKRAKRWPWEAWPFDDGHDGTAPVGDFRANHWGFVSMHGNVREWCADGKQDYPSDGADESAPASSSSMRVLRGGAWVSRPAFCRSAFRDYLAPGGRGVGVGFRTARIP